MKKRLITILLAMVLLFSAIISPVVVSAQTKTVDITVKQVKKMFSKLLDKLDDMDASKRAEQFLGIKIAMYSDDGIEELAGYIRAGDVFEGTLDKLEAEGVSRDTVADGILLFKIWDKDTRLRYISQLEDREKENPIEEEIELYEEIKKQFKDLEEILGEHNVDLGTLIIAASAVKIANDNKAIFTDDADNLDDFALKYISSSVKNKIDNVLSGYIINGNEYTTFDEMVNIYIDKVNERYTAERKQQLKTILEARDLYEKRETKQPGGGGGGGGAPVTSIVDKVVDKTNDSINKVISDLDSKKMNQSDVKDQVAALVEGAVREAAQVKIESGSVKVSAGVASASVKASEMEKAIENAVAVFSALEEKAKETGLQIKAEKVIPIVIPEKAGVKEVAVNLPAATLNQARDNGIDRIEISTQVGVISIASDALKNEIKKDSSTVELRVAQVEKNTLPADVAAKVGDKPIIDINIFVDGKKVSNFAGNNAVKITLDYKLAAGEDPDKIVVYYINDKGELEAVRNCKYDAATGKVTFTTNHLSKYTVMETKVTFDDIVNNWGKNYIEALAGRGIVNGLGENKFAPDGKITRAEFLKMLMYAFDLIDESATVSFDDVQKGAWYYESVASAYALGITKGIGDNKFGLNENIKRQDMATMAYRVAQVAVARIKKVNAEVKFNDAASIAEYAVESVSEMQRAGIITGIGDGIFAPNQNATRAEAAKIIFMLYKGL